jgi:hypothetical protein
MLYLFAILRSVNFYLVYGGDFLCQMLKVTYEWNRIDEIH